MAMTFGKAVMELMALSGASVGVHASYRSNGDTTDVSLSVDGILRTGDPENLSRTTVQKLGRSQLASFVLLSEEGSLVGSLAIGSEDFVDADWNAERDTLVIRFSKMSLIVQGPLPQSHSAEVH
jgi:hypothetical protein